jgi:hypothetical protein
MGTSEARVFKLQRAMEELLEGYALLDKRLTDFAEQLAEQNLRTLFLLRKSSFIIRKHGGVVLAGEPETQTMTGYNLYRLTREDFLTEMEALMKVEVDELLQQQKAEADRGDVPSLGGGASPDQVTGASGQPASPDPPSTDPASSAERSGPLVFPRRREA